MKLEVTRHKMLLHKDHFRCCGGACFSYPLLQRLRLSPKFWLLSASLVKMSQIFLDASSGNNNLCFCSESCLRTQQEGIHTYVCTRRLSFLCINGDPTGRRSLWSQTPRQWSPRSCSAAPAQLTHRGLEWVFTATVLITSPLTIKEV